jgi:hypothetical protein
LRLSLLLRSGGLSTRAALEAPLLLNYLQLLLLLLLLLLLILCCFRPVVEGAEEEAKQDLTEGQLLTVAAASRARLC